MARSGRVVIGAGVRLPPQGLALFEAVVNAVHRAAPAATIAFNHAIFPSPLVRSPHSSQQKPHKPPRCVIRVRHAKRLLCVTKVAELSL